MASRKRGQNEGAIYQRASDGKWVASVSLGYVIGSDGKPKRQRKTFYGKTRREVATKLAEALKKQQDGLPVSFERQTVAQFLDRWLTEIVKPSVRPKTYESYSQYVRLYIKPKLGHYQLATLTPQHVQGMLNDQLASGLSPRTVSYTRAILRRALGQALKWELVSRNVAALTEPPRAVHYEMKFLNRQQARQLLAAAEGDRLEALYRVALTLGLRQGEALGLRWQDVDFERGTVTVRHALQRIDGKLRLVEPKTAQSRRTIVMPSSVAAALKAHRDRQAFEKAAAGPRWVEGDFVFTTPKGTPLDARNVVRQFKALLVKAGLPDMRWHDLRHSCASLLLAQGVPYRVAMDILGHSQISLTMRYSHIIPELQEEAAAAMDRALS